MLTFGTYPTITFQIIERIKLPIIFRFANTIVQSRRDKIKKKNGQWSHQTGTTIDHFFLLLFFHPIESDIFIVTTTQMSRYSSIISSLTAGNNGHWIGQSLNKGSLRQQGVF